MGGFKEKIELLWKVYLEIHAWLGIDIFQSMTPTAYNNSENLYSFCAFVNPLFNGIPSKMDIQDGSSWPHVILFLSNSLQDGHLCEIESCF